MILSRYRYRYRTLPTVTERYRPLPNVTDRYRILPTVTESYRNLRYKRYQRYINFFIKLKISVQKALLGTVTRVTQVTVKFGNDR